MAHELSVTFPITTKAGERVWVNAASVNPDDPEGRPFSEDEVRERLMSGKQKAHSISDNHDDAITKAKARSKLGKKAPAASIILGQGVDE